ncbi:capZ-interacting protein isoform X2 [Oryzias melastigma]|uniref:capZ-interacting protein isoform X2 n=1 Tax=Oryzias melastigma TaxID=30732 RepID=UPI000CF83B71|nr:capZ-interacting protein isoform X2 [Oryzias melastigma]
MEDSPSKPSVAELAGRLKGHILPMPNSNDESPFRKRPPCSLKLQPQTHENEESENSVPPKPYAKMKNSTIIEKLQANLALSPTALLPSAKSPEGKLQPPTLTPTTPSSPFSPTLRPSHQSSEEEDPVSFDSPPEGATLPNFNKTRARLSFKRRPPTRQHRRSAGDEVEASPRDPSPSEPHPPKENRNEEQTFSVLTEETESAHTGGQRETKNKEEEEEKEDCEKIEAGTTPSDPDNSRPDRDLQEEQVKSAEDLEEEQLSSESVDQIEVDVKTEEQQDEAPQETKHEP